MFNLNRAIYSVVNRWCPEMAWRFVPPASNHLQLSPEQLQLMEDKGIYRIKLEYRQGVGIVPRSYWTTGEKDGHLPWKVLRFLPRDVLLITRNASGVFEIYAGPGYNSMPAVRFEYLVNQFLESAQESIEYMDFLLRVATAKH